MWQGLGQIREEFPLHDSLRVAVVSGVGNKALCSGLDLREDAREGPRAFKEKRKPKFQSR
jgi:enoyl-CoA hydratase/carnithine racemase